MVKDLRQVEGRIPTEVSQHTFDIVKLVQDLTPELLPSYNQCTISLYISRATSSPWLSTVGRTPGTR